MYEFKLPDVGEGIHEAEVLRWLVKEGETVAQDQPILEVQTDKAVVEIPSPVAGTVSEIRTEPGTIAHVGDTLILIAAADKLPPPAMPASSEERAVPVSQSSNSQPATSAVKMPGIAGHGQRVLAAPAVRKLALELGVDLAKVSGSGPAGRILPEDVRRFLERETTAPPAPPSAAKQTAAVLPPPVAKTAAAAPAEAPARDRRRPGQEITDEEPLVGLRRRIAERMEVAWRIPTVTSFDEVDVANLVALRQHLKAEAERRGARLTYLPFVIKATVRALKEFPYLNASLDMDRQRIRLHRFYHIGVATAAPDGLLVPVVRHADQLSAIQIAGELSRLTEAARERKLPLEELSGSTFTMTNFGSFGGSQGTPIINPPEVAILGVGRIEEKPVVREGQVEIRPILPLALSYDHRLLDGVVAGAFIERLKQLLADPNLLFLDLV